MNEKKIVRLAMIRSNQDGPCPFGLPIDAACRNVGDIMQSMLPVNFSTDDRTSPDLSEEEKEIRLKTNLSLYRWQSSGEPCKFAGKFFHHELPEMKHPKVQCLWNDGDGGVDLGASFVGSPYYYKHFNSIGFDGLYSLPTSSYIDTSIDRGHFYGVWALEDLEKERKKNGSK